MALTNSLPQELVMHISSFLTVPELLTCNYVCGDLNVISRDYSLWKRFFVDVKTTSAPPEGRLCHTGVVHDEKMFVFGGHTTQPSSEFFHSVKQDMHAYDFATRTWKILSDEGSRRTEHTTVVEGNKMYVFGGYSGIGYENSVVVFDIGTNTWSTMETKGNIPSARSAHTAVVYGKSMFVFGGWNGSLCMNDLHELNLETQIWSRVQSRGEAPCTRCSHGSAVFADGRMLIFGGYTIEESNDTANKGYLNDLFEFNFATKTWKTIPVKGGVPSPRSRFRMVSHNDSIYLFGGWNSATHFNTLFRYNTRSCYWEEIPTDFPNEGIGQFSLVVHNDVLYVFSGYSPVSGSRTNLFAYPLTTTPVGYYYAQAQAQAH